MSDADMIWQIADLNGIDDPSEHRGRNGGHHRLASGRHTSDAAAGSDHPAAAGRDAAAAGPDRAGHAAG